MRKSGPRNTAGSSASCCRCWPLLAAYTVVAYLVLPAFVADLEAAGMATAKYQVTGIGPTMTGLNGGGDLYNTDGEVWILRLVEDRHRQTDAVDVIPSPPATELKDQLWHAIADKLTK
jgi:hypothetical protein